MRLTMLVALCLLTTTVAVAAAPGVAALSCYHDLPHQANISCTHDDLFVVCVGAGVLGVLEDCEKDA